MLKIYNISHIHSNILYKTSLKDHVKDFIKRSKR